jgi:hypothetical protein
MLTYESEDVTEVVISPRERFLILSATKFQIYGSSNRIAISAAPTTGDDSA